MSSLAAVAIALPPTKVTPPRQIRLIAMLKNFYASLNDDQKARFNTMRPSLLGAEPDSDLDVLCGRGLLHQKSYCRKWRASTAI
jgi:hypothetical protein